MFKNLLKFTITAVIILAGGLAVIRHEDIIDWWLLRGYEPSPAIVALAQDTTMTDVGRRYFYVYDPQLLGRDNFWQQCTVVEASIVLGCYVSRQGIYIYDVEDEQLSGIRQVTAAHEMLHVAYERLSTSERERIDALTRDVHESLNNQRVLDTVQAYAERDSSVVPNELHSILATETRTLPEELETYYAQYFEDRLQVVAFSERYASVFEDARERVEQLDQQLRDRRQEISSLQDDLQVRASSLESQRAELNQVLANQDTERYNELVPVFNDAVRDYNADVARLGSLIDTYNQLVSERNNAASAQEQLVESIDSRPEIIEPKDNE
ncbi:hypothetical protein BH23PAT2_BH23PAT2_00220 [soil metagenome]